MSALSRDEYVDFAGNIEVVTMVVQAGVNHGLTGSGERSRAMDDYIHPLHALVGCGWIVQSEVTSL